MKICSPQLGLSQKSDLGGEVHDHFILQGLANRGHKIFVYLPRGRSHENNKNITVRYAPIKHIPAILFNFIILPYLFSTYKKERFDILRVHNPYFIGLGALFFKAFHSEVKIVATHHLVEKPAIFNLINYCTVNRYEAIIAVSNYLKNWLIKSYKVPQEKITVIYNGVDPDLFPQPKNQKLVKKYNLDDKFVILFMGLLIPRKNPLFLLEIFKKLKQKHKNISLIICGEGPLKSRLLNSINNNELKDVHLVGTVFGDDKADFFNLCDIFALPSRNEGFGLVVAEAMACAKPVVASDNSSLNEIITNGETGYLLKEKIDDWVDKISFLIENKDLRKKLGEGAKDKAGSDFNWSKATLAHEAVFKNLIKDDEK